MANSRKKMGRSTQEATLKLENILLLSCRSPFLDDSKIYAPMANLYLKGYVNQHMPNVNVVLGDDNYDLNNPDMFLPYGAIGISIMTPQRKEAEAILNLIKTHFPEKKVIAGGPHVKHYIKEVIKQPWDWVVPLDGEKPLVGILRGETKRFPNKYVRTSIWFEDDFPRRIVMDDIADSRILVDVMSKQDIENAPRPDRTSENAKQVIKSYHYKLGDRESTTMMTARGCPEQCAFCEDAMTPVKRSGLINLSLEMDDIKSLGYQGVYLFDDLFALSVDKSGEIGKLLKDRDLIYRCNAQARYFTRWGENMAKMLAETGCYEIAFGAESGSQKILDNIRKRTTVEMNYKTIEWANKYGIIVKAFILIGLPGETKETLRETEKLVKYLMENPKNDFGCYVFYPYKGTQARDALDRGEDIGLTMLVEEGLGAYGQSGGKTEGGVLRTKALNSEQLIGFRDYLVNTYRPQSGKVMWSNPKYRQENE